MTNKPSLSPVIVTGGCGFIGSHIVDGLLELEPTCEIHVLDIKLANLVPGVTYHTVDITDPSRLVFHVATAPALSTDTTLLHRVIITGTDNILTSSTKTGTVQALIYTSTSSLVHDNTSDLINADETLPVLRYPQQKKAYTLCKAVAEAEILSANNRISSNGMLTTAIRPASNFGPRDFVQLGKVVANIRAGKGHYQIGDGRNRYSFTYVTNTADAHLLAAAALLREYGRMPPRSDDSSEEESSDDRVDGQAFNITNDEDCLFWEYQWAVVAAMGRPVDPKSIVVIPFWLALAMAWIAEWVMWFVTLGRKKPEMTWEVVYYVSHHRMLKCEKAKRVIGSRPRVGMREGVERAVRWFVELEGEEEWRKRV